MVDDSLEYLIIFIIKVEFLQCSSHLFLKVFCAKFRNILMTWILARVFAYLNLLNGFDFDFEWRDTENQQ